MLTTALVIYVCKCLWKMCIIVHNSNYVINFMPICWVIDDYVKPKNDFYMNHFFEWFYKNILKLCLSWRTKANTSKRRYSGSCQILIYYSSRNHVHRRSPRRNKESMSKYYISILEWIIMKALNIFEDKINNYCCTWYKNIKT